MEEKSNHTETTFFMNTLIVVITGFAIKIMGLINRIIITRILGTEGMSLYILSFPTIMLFINIASFCLYISTSKLVSSSIQNHLYSPRQILKKSLKITFIVSISAIVILLIIIKPLTEDWLKNEKLFFPLLTTIILIPLVGISDTLKGYFNGLKKMKIASMATLIEQICRIAFSIGSLLIFMPYGIILATSATLFALSIGEIGSIVFLIIKIKKFRPFHFPNTKGETKAILEIAIPGTGTRLIGSITYFLEPIIYTSILIYLGYNKDEIQTHYTIINAYTIPLMTTASFLSLGIATAIIPSISENYALNKMNSIRYYIKKGIVFAFVPGILLSILFYTFPSEFMHLIYNTTEGASYIKRFIFIFIFYYLQAPLHAIMQGIGKSKLLFSTSTFFNILRIILIILFSAFPTIGLNSILYAILLTMVMNVLVILYQLIKITSYRFDWQNIFNIIILTISTVALNLFLVKFVKLPYLIHSLILTFYFIIIGFVLKIIKIESLSFKRKKNWIGDLF